jgi:hypothetical protein
LELLSEGDALVKEDVILRTTTELKRALEKSTAERRWVCEQSHCSKRKMK